MDKLSIFDLLESEINELEPSQVIASIRKKETLQKVLDVLKDYEYKKYNEPSETYDFIMMNFIVTKLPKKMSDNLVSCLIKDDIKFTEKRIKKLSKVKNELIDDIININTTPIEKFNSYDITSKIKALSKDNKTRKFNKDRYNQIITWIENNFIRRYSVLDGPTYYRIGDEININPDYNYYEGKAYEKTMELDREDGDAIKCRDLIGYTDIDPELATTLLHYGSLRQEIALCYQLVACIRVMPISDKYTKAINEMEKIVDLLLKRYDKYCNLAQKTIAGIDLDSLYEEREEEIQMNKDDENHIIKHTLHQ